MTFMPPAAPRLIGSSSMRVAFYKKLRKNLLLVGLLVFSTLLVAQSDERYYVGEKACRICHQTTHQWQISKHRQSYITLAKKESMQITRLSGIDVNPYQSPICLQCHTTASNTESWQRDDAFKFEDGIQCEYCHGPGSQYMTKEIMSSPITAKKAGLIMPDETFCLMCHKQKGSHTSVINVRPFDYKTFLAQIQHKDSDKEWLKQREANYNRVKKNLVDWKTKKKKSTIQESQTYKNPTNLALSPDGTILYAACQSSDSLIVINTTTKKRIKEINVQNQPHGICISDDNQKVYISNRGSDSVSIIDTKTFQLIKNIPVGDEPHGLMTTADSKILYVANAGSNDISVIDTQNNHEIKRLSAGRGTWDMNRSPDNQSVYVTNNLSHYVKFRTPPISEVTVIETRNSTISNRIMLPEANLVQGIDFAPNNEFALVTLLRTKNLVPITRVMQGWMITNGIGVLWKDGTVHQLLLDEGDNYFADPTDLVITPNGKFAYVSGGGIDKVAVIDLNKMKEVLKKPGQWANHLGISAEYVIKRIPVGRSPRGLTVSPDGRWVYVANGLDDTVSVIRVSSQEPVAVIDLGGPKEITLQRRGERIFHSADITYGRQFSCHTCHPDGGIDGITYDIEPDGIGLNPVDNRTLRGILDTAPFKWTGKNPTLSRQCGPRLAVFFTRIDPFTPEQVIALEHYICTIPRNPNRHNKGNELSEAQQRGKILFQRTIDNEGKAIPYIERCNNCHSGPYFTNRTRVDVGTKSHLDTHGVFDVPHLNNIYETPPYLHDGRADTLEEIWTRFNPKDQHGRTNDMTKDQLNDLIEYLKTL